MERKRERDEEKKRRKRWKDRERGGEEERWREKRRERDGEKEEEMARKGEIDGETQRERWRDKRREMERKREREMERQRERRGFLLCRQRAAQQHRLERSPAGSRAGVSHAGFPSAIPALRDRDTEDTAPFLRLPGGSSTWAQASGKAGAPWAVCLPISSSWPQSSAQRSEGCGLTGKTQEPLWGDGKGCQRAGGLSAPRPEGPAPPPCPPPPPASLGSPHPRRPRLLPEADSFPAKAASSRLPAAMATGLLPR